MTYYTLTPTDRSGTTAASERPAPINALVVLRSLPAGIDTTQILIEASSNGTTPRC